MKPVLKKFPVVSLAPGMKVLVPVQKSLGVEIEELTVLNVEARGHAVIVFYAERPWFRHWYMDRESVKMMALEDAP